MDTMFSYVIGTISEDGRVSAYMSCSTEVFFGSETDAKKALYYVKKQTNCPDYQIFRLNQV